MEKIFCSECGTENESEFIYCKNCGNQLKPLKNEIEGQGFQNQNPEPTTSFSNDALIEGIPSEEISIFIGKKQANILPKFLKMEYSGSKISWCWPAAILSFLLGPFGASIWFFYRKMYKPAIIFTGLGAIITAITTALTFGETSTTLEALVDAFSSADRNAIINAFENISPTETILTIIASAIEEIANIATLLFSGLFGFYIYKNHCVSKIKDYKNRIADERYYKIGLSAIGGVSEGMLALGIILMFVSQYIISIISSILAFVI